MNVRILPAVLAAIVGVAAPTAADAMAVPVAQVAVLTGTAADDPANVAAANDPTVQARFAAASQLAAAHPADFAPVYLNGSKVMLPAVTAAGVSLARAAAGWWQVSRAPRSTATLHLIMDEIMGLDRAATGGPVDATSVDEQHDRVVVSMSAASADFRTALAARYGTEAVVIRLRKPIAVHPNAGTRLNETSNFAGGGRIDVDQSTCSSGFAWNAIDVAGMLTAGHCADSGTGSGVKAADGSTLIGPVIYDNFVQNSGTRPGTYGGDLAVYQVTNLGTAPSIHTGDISSATTERVLGIKPPLPQYALVCLSASVTGESCNWEIMDTDITVTYNHATVTHLVHAHSAIGPCTIEGDSGGAVFVRSTDPSRHGVLAVGIEDAGGPVDPNNPDGPCDMYYTSMFTVTQDINGSIKLDSNRGDFTGDNVPDIVAENASTTNLILYSTNGLGAPTVQAVTGTDFFNFEWFTRPGDFDGDHIPDLIARNKTNLNLYLFKGVGDGKVLSGLQIGGNWGNMDNIMSPGDFDGDGYPDLIARNAVTCQLMLFRGNGTGGFAATTAFSGSWCNFNLLMSPGDFNSDGHPDVIGRLAANSSLLYYTGNGVGLASAGTAGTNFQNMVSLVGAGDVDHDGHNDLIGYSNAGSVLLFSGNGAGRISATHTLSTGFGGNSVMF